MVFDGRWSFIEREVWPLLSIILFSIYSFFLSSISTIILFIPFKMLKWQSRNILKYVQCGWTEKTRSQTKLCFKRGICLQWYSLSLSLSVPLYYAKYILGLWPLFYSTFSFFFSFFFRIILLAYLSHQSPFSREHNFVGFKEFPSLVFWCTVIHHHGPQGPTLFAKSEMGFYECVQTRNLLF